MDDAVETAREDGFFGERIPRATTEQELRDVLAAERTYVDCGVRTTILYVPE